MHLRRNCAIATVLSLYHCNDTAGAFVYVANYGSNSFGSTTARRWSIEPHELGADSHGRWSALDYVDSSALEAVSMPSVGAIARVTSPEENR